MSEYGALDRMLGWNLLIAPKSGRRVYLENFPDGSARLWGEQRDERVVDSIDTADLHLKWGRHIVAEMPSHRVPKADTNQTAREFREYALLPVSFPRLLVPLHDRDQVLRGLAMHRPGRYLARKLVTLLHLGMTLGVAWPLRHRLLRIERRIACTFDPASVLYLGTADDRRKTTILPTDTGKILKYGTSSKARQSLRKEAETLRILSGTPLADYVPRLLSLTESRNSTTLAQEYRERSIVCRKKQEAETAAFLAKIATIGTEYRGGTPGHFCHGDFAPWNCIYSAQGLFVFDWEDSRDWAPALEDAFYYVVAPSIHKRVETCPRKLTARAIGFARRVVRIAGLSLDIVVPLWRCWLERQLAQYQSPIIGSLRDYAERTYR